MRRWAYGFIGIAGTGLALVLYAMSPKLLLGFLVVATVMILVNCIMNWRWTPIILGGLLMFAPLPIVIAQYPTSRQIRCEKIQLQPPLANCQVRLKTLSSWGSYRKDYGAIKQAKVMTVNAKRRPGKRSSSLAEHVIVQLYPVFMVDQSGRSQKLEKIEPHEPTATSITTQVNQFLQGSELSLRIDIMDVIWEQDFSGGGNKQPSQQDYVVMNLFAVPLFFVIGLVIMLKSWLSGI
jgi:hypothetical protein